MYKADDEMADVDRFYQSCVFLICFIDVTVAR